MTWQTESTSSESTERLGRRLGQNLRGGEAIELISDLGGGKTTLVHGIADGLGSTDKVTSPTFKISNVYKGRKELWHFDFYRLSDAGVIEYELAEVLGNPDIVVVVEWGDVINHVLPEKHLAIHINKLNENSRRLSFHYPKELEYLLENI